jgi:hypothetical protein
MLNVATLIVRCPAMGVLLRRTWEPAAPAF